MLRRGTRGSRHTRVACAIAGTLTGAWLLSAPANAGAAAQIGETFAPAACSELTDTVFLQSMSPGDAYVVPFDGVVTSWSYQAGGNPPAMLELKVGRSAGADDFTIVGESGLQ